MASVTISLSRPFTGAEIMAAVKAVAEQGDKKFYADHDYVDGDIYRIGQVSGYPYHHVLVSPTRDEESMRPDVSYDQVVVSSHQWPVPTYLVGYSDGAVTNAVREFGEALDRHLSGANEAEKPSVWPQEVTVCALCERIISGGLDAWCSKDGENPPTRTVQVMPLAS
jgi:hypothetical protein